MDYLSAQQRAKYPVTKILRRHPQDVEDCLQNAVIKAMHGEFRGEAAFQSWFTRIAINEALQILRRYRSKVKREQQMQEWQGEDNEVEIEPPSEDRGPEDRAMLIEQIGAMREEIEGLPKGLRGEATLFLMEVDPGPDGNRKSNRFRLRRALRQRMAERGYQCVVAA